LINSFLGREKRDPGLGLLIFEFAYKRRLGKTQK